MRELERLYRPGPFPDDFHALWRASKWGDRIREDLIEALKQHHADAIEDGVLYLEESPRYFQSGYRKCSIASKLKSAPLTSEQRQRLLAVILRDAASERIGPEFSEYARLAAIIATPAFVKDVISLRDKTEGWARERCKRVLRHCCHT